MTLIKIRGLQGKKKFLNHSFSSILNAWLVNTRQEDQPRSSTQKSSFQKLQGTLNSGEMSQTSSKSLDLVSSQKPNKSSLICGKQQAPHSLLPIGVIHALECGITPQPLTMNQTKGAASAIWLEMQFCRQNVLLKPGVKHKMNVLMPKADKGISQAERRPWRAEWWLLG